MKKVAAFAMIRNGSSNWVFGSFSEGRVDQPHGLPFARHGHPSRFTPHPEMFGAIHIHLRLGVLYIYIDNIYR